MFVRFVVGSDGEHHRELTGIGPRQRFLRDEQGATNRRRIAEKNISDQTSSASMAPTTARHTRSMVGPWISTTVSNGSLLDA
jgi:hypothetical protein